MAVIEPWTSSGHTCATARPGPQPTSRMLSPGETDSSSTAHRTRKGASAAERLTDRRVGVGGAALSTTRRHQGASRRQREARELPHE